MIQADKNLLFPITKVFLIPHKLFNKNINLVILGIAIFFYFYQFLLRVFPGSITSELMKDFSLGAYPLSIIISLYYYGYAFMQIPVGMLLDRFGVRYSLILGALSCTGGILIFLQADNFFILSFGRLLMGVGSAFGFLTCLKVSNSLFPIERLATLIGLSVMVGMVGAIGGCYPFAKTVLQIGWRPTLTIVGIIGSLIVILSYMFIKDYNFTFPKDSNKTKSTSCIIKETLQIFKAPQTWVLGSYGGLMYMVLSTFSDLWGPTYISHAYDVDCTLAAGSVSCLYLGMAIGSPLLASIVSFLKSYCLVMRIGAVFSAFIFTLVIYCPHFIQFYFTYSLFFLIGLVSSVQILAFSSVCYMHSSNVSGTASGIHNMMCMLSGVIFQPVIGFLLDIQWEGILYMGIPHYSMKSYFIALSILPLGLTLAFFLSFFIKETYSSK